MKKKAGWIALQAFFGVLENSLAVLFMCINAELIDSVVTQDMTAFLTKIPYVICVLVLQIIFLYMENVCCVKIKSEYGFFVRTSIYSNIMRSGKQRDSNKASVLNIYNTYLGQEQEYVARMADIAVSLVTLGIAALVMMRMNAKLFFASLILIPLSGTLYQRINKPLQKKNAEIIKRKETINRDVKQIIDGFYMIKAYILEERFGQYFLQDAKCLKKSEQEKDKINSGLGRVGIILRYMPQLIIPLYGGWLCIHKELTVGELTAMNTVIWYVISPIENLLDIHKNKKLLAPVKAEIEKLSENAEETEAEADREYAACKEKKIPMVEIQNGTFSYLQKDDILRGLNLRIEKGEHVILMGESGCGKSTIANILCGFEAEYGGSIRLDGTEITKETIPFLQKKTGYVPQEPYIYSGSIRENICMGRDVKESRLKQVLEVSGVSDVIEKFPDGLDTLVGEGGIRLSGGQRKKIAVARALAEELPFYILDEPLSALDAGSAEKMQEKVSAFLKGKTVLVITHQPPADWQEPDKCYYLEKGTIRNEKKYPFFGE